MLVYTNSLSGSDSSGWLNTHCLMAATFSASDLSGETAAPLSSVSSGIPERMESRLCRVSRLPSA